MSQASSTTNKQLIIPQPAANEALIVTAHAEPEMRVEFTPGSASAERVENNLVFSFSNGGKVTITDFFVTEGEALPLLTLPDGAQVASATMLAALNADMDLSVAAGPATRSSEGGMNDYADDAGALLGGVDKLGAGDRLGQWGNPETSALITTPLLAATPAAVATAGAAPAPQTLEGQGIAMSLLEQETPGTPPVYSSMQQLITLTGTAAANATLVLDWQGTKFVITQGQEQTLQGTYGSLTIQAAATVIPPKSSSFYK